MGLTMKERKAVIKETYRRYRRSTKKEKGEILNEFIKLTGYKRKYASWILRNWGKTIWIKFDGKPVKIIAGNPKDHLEEFPNYYTELKKMEDKLEKEE